MGCRLGQAYEQDLRDRVLAAAGAAHAVAARLGVSPSYVVKERARQRDRGDTTPGRQCNHVPARLARLHDVLRARVATHADTTLAELRRWVLAEHGVPVSHQVMWKTLRELGLTLKKSQHAAEQDRPDVAEARATGRAAQPNIEPDRLVLIDG